MKTPVDSVEAEKETNSGDDIPEDERSKIDLAIKPKMTCIGHGSNVNQRFVNQLKSISALMSLPEKDIHVTDDRFKVLASPGCSNGLCMEWTKDDDCYFLWGSSASKKLVIKFEFHGGLDASAILFNAKNPSLVFSELFDENDEIWSEVKLLLRELFRVPDEGLHAEHEHDYLFAFTRTGLMFHLQVFKILDHPPPDTKCLKLQQISPAFMFKPLEIFRGAGIDDAVSNYRVSDIFFDAAMLMFKGNSGLDLKSCPIMYDKGYADMIPHTMQLADLHVVMLPSPAINCELFGFNMSSKDFFRRYHVYKTVQVKAIGQDPNPPPIPLPFPLRRQRALKLLSKVMDAKRLHKSLYQNRQ